MLNPNETFEIYENRGHSPLSLERINPVSNSNESLRQQEPEQRKFAIFRVIERQKGKGIKFLLINFKLYIFILKHLVPIGWISMFYFLFLLLRF